MTWLNVSSVEGLMEAVASGTSHIEVVGTLRGMPSLTLPPGTALRGGTLSFGAKGLRLTSDNSLSNITVTTASHEAAILNDTTVAGLGTLSLHNVTATGQIFLTADGSVRSGRIEADGVHVTAADTRGRFHRPTGFGVEALQGAFTVWNRQVDPAVRLTARLEHISAGSAAEPVHGGGVFVGGHGDTAGMADGGSIDVELLSTVDVFSNGGIAPGTPDLISGGVFVISGANVAEVRNLGTTTTYGQNDMVLDNWGAVTAWNVHGAVTSWGPSGIGFVNFGSIGTLTVDAPVETFGLGARGFNVYDGSLQEAVFESITTHGDGSVGVQVSRELPALTIRGDLRTEGGTGESLVKGVLVQLSAIALSVKSGGRIGTASIGGDVRTEGAAVPAMELEGTLDAITVGGVVTAAGGVSDVVRFDPGLAPVLAGLTIEGR
ncbi:hypothetical protein ART_0975 [Arthrobacter sp. PAMC 25486]|uniref:hypothetical protein n=1 Tax=Arthrobacter sp. PAMC 25486 TaxID=1494608 RepID=UPI000535A585|nr:hypothetical protein [Arthrobacter sp. PAMC 25486]AIY00574.1 hypothetical protein ART_0975 [Arthrobacter sp. PAMC 25486]